MVSKCCKDKLFAQGDSEGTYYYVCVKCAMPTDGIHPGYEPGETENAVD